MRLPLTVLTRYIFLILFLATASVSVAQEEEPTERRGSRIIDDSTKQIYGPTTSFYFYEDDFFRNNFKLHTIDTTPWNFHRFGYVQRYNNLYQDLGNIGTAIRPIFHQVTETIGAASGFDAYELYWNSETIQYYNTRSPYSNMKVILGGGGRSVTRVTFSRNINPRWNFGFNYRTLLIDKQIQRQGKGDRDVRSTYYDVYTAYHSKDSTYSAFLNYTRNVQQADEFGGVLVEDDFTYADLFEENAQRSLTEAESNDRRSNVHLFHQYNVGTALQVYHKMDVYKQVARFTDTPAPNNEFYDFVVVDSARTSDRIEFKSFRNEAGIKGNLLKLFYNGYVASRKFSMDYKYFYEDNFYLDTENNEFYVGGRIALQVDSLIEVKGWAEWMLDERYLLHGSIQTKWFEASLKRSVASPTFLQQAYRGSHDIWLNNFSSTESTEIKGNLIYRSKRLSVYPGVRFSALKNYIFFKENSNASGQRVLPLQSDGYQTWVTPELNFSISISKGITFSTQALYTRLLENGDDAIQVPELFINSQLAYADIWFNGNFDFQAGIDAHWKSEYYAPAYDIAVQQFYVQTTFVSPSFPVIDVFLNFRIKRARLFLKYNNALKAFSDYANIPTPFYPGIQNMLDFGFDWSFYD